MSADELSAVAGIVLSLFFSYVPGVKGWFEGLESSYKQMVMGGLLVAVGLSVFGLACSGIVDMIVCDKAGALGLVKLVIEALIANQAVYLITKK